MPLRASQLRKLKANYVLIKYISSEKQSEALLWEDAETRRKRAPRQSLPPGWAALQVWGAVLAASGRAALPSPRQGSPTVHPPVVGGGGH